MEAGKICGGEKPRILVATDGSLASEKAVTLAVNLARVLGGELHAVSVICDQLKRDEAHDAIERVKELFPDVHAVIREGHPASEIIECAGEVDADLIVTGSHNRSGLERVFIGSVSEKIVRHAGTSVLVARSSEIPKRVLIATDGSEHSRLAMELIRHVREKIPLKVTAVHVMDTSDPVSSQLFFEELQQRRDHALSMARKILGDSAECISVKGHPVSVIAEISARYDMVVLGSHGRSGIDHLLLGSVAERVARFSKSSTLIVRGKRLNTSP
ncbi:universal stress protein [Geoglobus acetivorans]|uniref:Universal stress protein family n=1 Tax=Geoglobus acetivorans TaxID=565033 RepID=A0A0A7GER9_GEOAI|nr:Universal stress protein family [Geoglobus acetivorans]